MTTVYVLSAAESRPVSRSARRACLKVSHGGTGTLTPVSSTQEALEMAQKITPCLWFDINGEEAMNYYVKDASIHLR